MIYLTEHLGIDGVFHVLYLTKNVENGMIYVGIHNTKNLNDGYQGSGKYFLRAMKKHGKENFLTVFLAFSDTEREILDLESIIVDREFAESPHTYNLSLGGGIATLYGQANGFYGKNHTEETKEKIRQKTIEQFSKPENRELLKLLASNRSHTKETKEKISLASKGENNGFYGKNHTEETKQAMRDKWTEERRKVLGEQKSGDKSNLKGLTGSKNPGFRHYFHTPWGIFESKDEVFKSTGFPTHLIKKFCNTPEVVVNSVKPSLDKAGITDYLGKTYREIGFFKIPKEEIPTFKLK